MWRWALAAVLAAGACGHQAAGGESGRGDTVPSGAPAAALSDSELIEGVAASDSLPLISLPDLENVPQPLLIPGDDVTVVNFWASWCAPCLAEIPQLVAFHDHWKGRGVRVVGVAVASGDGTDIHSFAAQHHMDYDVLMADEGNARRYLSELHLPASLPLSLVVDSRGVVRRKFFGPHTESQFAAATRSALQQAK